MATPEQVKKFIEKVVPFAQNEYKKGKKILPSVCIAQCCCESGYGTTEKMLNANAMLGVKVGKSKVHFGNAWHDKAYSTKTKECYDGKTYTEITDFFRAYDSIEDCITDYYDMLCSCSRYRAAVGETDYVKAITAIRNGGYDTSPTYISTITSIIQKNNLTKYDMVSSKPIIHTGGSNMSKVENAVQYALAIAADDSHGYDQKKRWGDDYDCSALVIESFEEAGIPVKSKGATYTGNMKKIFMANGFEDVISKVNVLNGTGLQRGDVLLKEGSHTAIYIGNGQLVHASINEKGTVTGGKVGDQTGKEICTRAYYNKPWNSVLRYGEAEAPTSATKSVDEIAKEVIADKWGSGVARKKKLEAAGYTYSTIQNRVNALLNTNTKVEPVVHKVKKGDTLSKIAVKYGTTVDEIVRNNRATYPKIKSNFIICGWVLKV